jgi:predicted PurR-regulated permease PerM
MGRRIFALLVAALFLYIASSMLLPVLMGGILAVLFEPVLVKFEKFKVSTLWASAVLTLSISLLILVPIAGMVFFGAKYGFQQLQHFKQSPGNPQTGDWIDALIDTPHFRQILLGLARYFPVSVASLADSAHDIVQGGVARLGNWLEQFVSALPGLVMSLAVTTVSLFFLLVDGRNLIIFFRRNKLFSPSQTEQLIHAMAGLCRSVILASLVSGTVQAFIMLSVGFAMGIPNTGLISGLVFLGSFVPVIGSAPITIGVTLHQFFMVDNSHGIAMLVMAIVIAAVDNFVRPLVLRGGSTHLHPLLAFVAAFGGLQSFGFIGVFLGPIVAGLFVATVQILLNDRAEAPAV